MWRRGGAFNCLYLDLMSEQIAFSALLLQQHLNFSEQKRDNHFLVRNKAMSLLSLLTLILKYSSEWKKPNFSEWNFLSDFNLLSGYNPFSQVLRCRMKPLICLNRITCAWIDVSVNILLSETRIRNSPENIPSVTICYQLFDHWNSTRKENIISKYIKKKNPRAGGIFERVRNISYM